MGNMVYVTGIIVFKELQSDIQRRQKLKREDG
jgi:hypothetical protein